MRPPRHLLRRHPKHDDTSIRLGSGHKGIGTYIALTSIYSWLFNTTGSSDGLDDACDNDSGDDDDDDDDGGGGGKAVVDNSCMQSREVWTGTTYALAAAMIHESLYYNRQDNDCNGDNDDDDGRGYHSKGEQLTGEERRRLRSMAFNTSRGE